MTPDQRLRVRALADLAKALAVLDEEGDAWGIAIALSATSRIRSIFGDFEGAEETLERTLTAARSSVIRS